MTCRAARTPLPLYLCLYVCSTDTQIINGTHEGEPLNAILSADSDPAVLVDSEDLGGFRNYMLCVSTTR